MAAPPGRPVSPQEAHDATRRTWLANERTWLAWVRPGLTATAVALALGKVFPSWRTPTRAGRMRRWRRLRGAGGRADAVWLSAPARGRSGDRLRELRRSPAGRDRRLCARGVRARHGDSRRDRPLLSQLTCRRRRL